MPVKTLPGHGSITTLCHPLRMRPPLAWRSLTAGLTVLAAVLVWSSTRYGYHRDELYFLACGRRLAWGYPDQPPLTPALARLMSTLAPHSLVALRLPAVLIAVWATLLAALIARELNGRGYAQGLAALAVGTGVVLLLGGRVLSTATIDLGIWVTLSWLLVVLLRTGQDRLWVAIGAVLGLGLLNKQLPVVAALALLVGMLLSPAARPLLRSRWLPVGAAIALACWTPVLIWQARHGWPQVTLAGQIHTEYGRADERVAFAVQQVVMFSLAATALWVTGLIQLFRDPGWARFRPLAWTWPVPIAVFAVTAGQGYYPVGVYPALIAAGAVVVERRARVLRLLVPAAVLLTALPLTPVALPLLSPSALEESGLRDASEPQLEMVGWPGLVDQVARVYRALPSSSGAAPSTTAAPSTPVVLLTTNYGEAGALEEYGPARGLPAVAYSGHNGFGLWGPPPAAATGPVILVWEGPPPDVFTGCRDTGRVRTGVRNEEDQNASVYVCNGPTGGWAAAWPRLVHLSA